MVIVQVLYNILKKDCKAKLLIGCNEEEIHDILIFLNQTDYQKAVILRRGNEIPEWANVD